MTLDPGISTLSYRVCGINLVSDAPFPELSHCACKWAEGDAVLRVELTGRQAEPTSPVHWFLNWNLPSGELWLSTAKIEGGYLLRFHGWADFTVDTTGRNIICCPERGTPEDTLRHLLLDQVLPLVLTLQGRQAFHATAVQTPQGVCAFIGPTGVGKSTLAASFLVASYPVLSDDCLVLDETRGQFLAMPGYPGLRLWDDSLAAMCDNRPVSLPVAHYTSKRRPVIGNNPAAFFAEPQPLAGIYALVRPDEADVPVTGFPIIEHLCRRDAFMELLICSYRFDITDRTVLVQQFDFLDRLASAVPVRRLHLPNSFSALPEAREAILADLRSR